MSTEQKSNLIVPIYLPFTAIADYVNVNLHVPFRVKRIRYVSSSWGSTDNKLGTTLSLGYLSSSNLPQAQYLALLDAVGSANKAWEIIYSEATDIRGTYNFDIRTANNVHFFPTQNTTILLVLEFCRE